MINHSFPSLQQVAELKRLLCSQKYHYYITLSTNGGVLPNNIDKLRTFVRRWEAFMNRDLIGPKWAKPKYRDERLFSFFAYEKLAFNPHCHALIRFYEEDPAKRAKKSNLLLDLTEYNWTRICPPGSATVRLIDDLHGVVNYVAKELHNELSYYHFSVPDEFSPH